MSVVTTLVAGCVICFVTLFVVVVFGGSTTGAVTCVLGALYGAFASSYTQGAICFHIDDAIAIWLKEN
jgi:asparagine N-glycosylation enzyme membrane subunit Stt3